MKLLVAAIVLVLIVETTAQWHQFPRQAYRGYRDMRRAYTDMREANWKNSDKYFHARGNYDAARRGAGGRWAAKVISGGRELTDRLRGGSAADSAADQAANRWGRNGGNPNRYRPKGLPAKYYCANRPCSWCWDTVVGEPLQSTATLNSAQTANMKLLVAAIVLVLIVETTAQWHQFPRQAYQGYRDMRRAYTDMREANWKNSDKYFHARGNYDAARRGAGGRWAAKVISDGRELTDRLRGGSAADSAADQAANRWGRNGGNPNRYRPKGLPAKY
ncbi:serum amyloid A [Nelusetta ayraudi]|uniref:serum amyloid A n=1 Tax=Nelusetta ayraudi TaxID=303726 RepID=UPI003F71CB9B